MLTDLRTYLHHRFRPGSPQWRPFVAVQYLTYRCDFRCPYCSNGFAQPYHQLDRRILPADQMLRLLQVVRNNCHYLVLTGGEPLQHPEFPAIVAGAGEMGFKDLALNTNGYELDTYLPVIAASVDTLIVSLDTLDPVKADSWYGVHGAFERIMRNLRRAAAYPDRRFRIIVSAVATPANIPDLYDVYGFCRKNGFMFAVAPELQGVKPPQELRDNDEYERFFNFLLAEKRRGGDIHGTPLYLAHMRDFSHFRCRPLTMLVVDPLGGVFYPCLEIGNIAGNLLESDNLHDIRAHAEQHYGGIPKCDSRCHSACALGFALILNRPLSMLEEVFVRGKSMLTHYSARRRKTVGGHSRGHQ